MVLYKFISY